MDGQIEPITNPLSGLSSAFPTDSLLQITFLCLLAGYIVFSIVLHYHWTQYGTNKRMTLITLAIYAVITLPVIVTLGLIALAA